MIFCEFYFSRQLLLHRVKIKDTIFVISWYDTLVNLSEPTNKDVFTWFRIIRGDKYNNCVKNVYDSKIQKNKYIIANKK